MIVRTSTHLRRLAAAGALAAGAMMLTAPAGNAIPESTIASECFQAGGTYTSTVAADGKRYSKCCYRDIDGVQHCDNYVNGAYTNTTGALEQSPTSPPQPPPGGVVGPPADAAERQPAAPDDVVLLPRDPVAPNLPREAAPAP